jgi:DNA-binding transcriptional ArsR family regulator
MDDVFKALAHPIRRTLLDELTERDGQTLFELCVRLHAKGQYMVSRQAISKHLAQLEAAQLIRIELRGKYKLHYFNPAPMTKIYERWVAQHKDPGKK